MTSVHRFQKMVRMRSAAVVQLSKVRRVHSESIVSSPGGHHVYKPRTLYRRYLDGQENVFHEYYKRNLIAGLMCTLTKSRVPLKEKTVRQALSLLCRRQTLLRARVFEAPDGVNHYYESVSGIHGHKINLNVLDRSVDERFAVWEELLSSMDYERDEGCLWKAVLLREKFDQDEQCYYNALIMSYSHSIVDAGSMLSLSQQLLHYIEILAKGCDVTLSDVKEYPLFPSQTGLLAHVLPKFERRLKTFQEDIPNAPNTTNDVLASFPTCADQDLSPHPVSKAMMRHIPWCDLQKLVSISRKHHSTLTGLLTAICHIAFASLLDPASLSPGATNDTVAFINTSKHNIITVPEGYPIRGVATLAYDLPLPAVEKDLWGLAASFSKQLHTDINNFRQFEALLKANYNALKIMENNLNDGALPFDERSKSYHMVSNPIPVFTQTDPKIFSMEEMFGGLPAHGRGGTFRNYLLTLNGNMTYVTVYDASFISTKVAQKYYDCVTRLFHNILQSVDQF